MPLWKVDRRNKISKTDSHRMNGRPKKPRRMKQENDKIRKIGRKTEQTQLVEKDMIEDRERRIC